jgi:ribosomal protein L17
MSVNARIAVQDLARTYRKADILLSDSLFLECLEEEIVNYWRDNLKLNESYVRFTINESGEPIYDTILTEDKQDGNFYVKIAKSSLGDKAIEKTQTKITEFQTSADKLIDSLKEAKESSKLMIETLETAAVNADLDIKNKQRMLLDRLLEDKGYL